MVAKLKKDDFIANRANKQRFINLLGAKLELSGCTVIHAEVDVDLLLVQTAVQSTKSVNTVLVGDDTDLLVLLCQHAEMNANELFFRPEPKQRTQTRKIWNIKETKSLLGPEVCRNILFVHAFLGSDTTSRLHGIGKGVALTKIRTDVLFRQQADVFNRDGATKDEIILAGEKSLLWVYNDGLEEDLISAAREPSTYVCSCCLSQPEGLIPGTAMERCIAEYSRVGMEVDRWKTAAYTNGPATST